jgi:ankyrin repeat protein
VQRRGITPKYNDMMTAVLRGDREAAKQLLDLGWWVDKPSANGITPLMAAVMNRDTQMVQLLLEHGAEPSAQALKLARKNKDAATASLLEQKGAK